jgi:hypothetical protein
VITHQHTHATLDGGSHPMGDGREVFVFGANAGEETVRTEITVTS